MAQRGAQLAEASSSSCLARPTCTTRCNHRLAPTNPHGERAAPNGYFPRFSRSLSDSDNCESGRGEGHALTGCTHFRSGKKQISSEFEPDRQVTLCISNWSNCPIDRPESGGVVLVRSMPFHCNLFPGDFTDYPNGFVIMEWWVRRYVLVQVFNIVQRIKNTNTGNSYE